MFSFLKRSGKWSKRQKEHRRLCRLEDKELEHLANWMHLEDREMLNSSHPHRHVKTTQEPKMTRVATHVPTDPDSSILEAPEGLPDEFTDNADPKGDACCYEPKCPCHGGDE